ncbi:MAG: VWA domain-containing protein [Candidatus Micrarchaeota archaeon]
MNSNRGFAIALDALMAIILVTTIIVFLSSQPLTVFPTIDNSQRLSQTLSSTFTALDNAGVLNETLIDQTFNQDSVDSLYLQAKKLLPSNTGLAISVTAFDTAEDYQNCRQNPSFSNCFPTNGNWFVSSDQDTQNCTDTLDECITQHAVRNDRDVIYGKKIIVNRQATGETTGGETTCEVAGIELKNKPKPRPTIAMLDENGPPILEFETLAEGTNPANTMICTDDENTDPPPENTVSTITLHTRNRTRSPIDVVLVLDKSGSMSKLDMNLQNPNSGQFNEGKCLDNAYASADCNADTTIPSNCGNYSIPGIETWIPVGSFDLNQDTYGRLIAGGPYANNIAFWNQYTSIQPGSTYQCSNAKIRIKQPGTGTYLYSQGNPSMDFAYIAAWVNPYPAMIGFWDVELWADQPTQITRPLSVSMWKGSRPADIINDGAVPGVPKDSSCTPNESDWHPVGTISITDSGFHTLSAAVIHNYNYPEGICGVGVRLRDPNGAIVGTYGPSKGSPVTTTCGTNWDDPLSSTSPYDPIVSPTGNYTVEAWADRDVTVSSIIYQHKVFVSKIEPITLIGPTGMGKTYPPERYPTVPYNAGLCSSPPATCYASSVTQGTCTWRGPDYTATMKDLSSHPISASPRGMRADITNYNYSGVCANQVFRIINPSDAVVNSVAGAKPTGNTCMTINRNSVYDNGVTWPGSGACTDATGALSLGTWKVQGWSDVQSHFTVTWKQERIDAAQQAAGNFIDNSHWSELDNIGIVSYSTTASSDTGLLEASPANKAILKSSMNNLTPNGETWTEGGILAATELLTATSENNKYIILLSDGLSNLPAGTGPEAARVAAQSAHEHAGITVFTIAFGNDALQPDGSCSIDLQNIALAGNGQCYPASDPNQLRQIYELIAAQIQQSLGNTNLIMPLPAGTSIKNPQCMDTDGNQSAAECLNGIFLRTDNNSSSYTETEWPTGWHRINSTNESIVFKGIAINKNLLDEWWTATFKLAVPCNSSFCIENLTLPPTSTYIEETRWRIPWPPDDDNGTKEQQTITIQKKDLRFKFLNGTITDNNVDLTMEIKNTGNYPIDFTGISQEDGQTDPNPCDQGTIVQIYRNISEPPVFNTTTTPTANWIKSACIQPDSPMDINASTTQIISIPNEAEASEGYLYGIIQPNFPECRQNNWDKILCFSNPKTRFFLVEYWGWIK